MEIFLLLVYLEESLLSDFNLYKIALPSQFRSKLNFVMAGSNTFPGEIENGRISQDDGLVQGVILRE